MASADAPVIVEGVLGRGSRVEGYLIEAEIGRGGMATVYRVSLPELRAEAAMKVPHLGLSAEWLEQFRHEAELLFNLSNQHIVKPRAFGRLSDGRPWLVMELHRGDTLAAALEHRAGGVGVSEALRYGIQLCRGLGAAHAAGIIHRDLKPENILFDANETVTVSDKEVPTLRLSDFGLASRVGEAFTSAGTIDYLSPEQAQQRPPDARADLFSLGAVLYELLSGQLPWQRQQDGDTEERIKARLLDRIEKEGSRLELVAGDVPREVADVVHKLLALDPARRYQNADEVRAALEVKLKQFENRTERTHANVSVEELRRAEQRNVSTDLMLPPVIAAASRRRWWGVAVVLLLLAGVAWLLRPAPPAVERVAAAEDPLLALPAVIADAGAVAAAVEPEVLDPLSPILAPKKPIEKPVEKPRLVAVKPVEASTCLPDDDWKRSARADLDELTQRSSKRTELLLWAADENEAISKAIAVASTRGDCGAIERRLQLFNQRVKGAREVLP